MSSPPRRQNWPAFLRGERKCVFLLASDNWYHPFSFHEFLSFHSSVPRVPSSDYTDRNMSWNPVDYLPSWFQGTQWESWDPHGCQTSLKDQGALSYWAAHGLKTICQVMLQVTTTNQYEMEDEPLFIESLHENSEKASLILRDDIYNVHNKRPASRSYVECWQRKKEKKWYICYLYPRKEDSWPESSGETS